MTVLTFRRDGTIMIGEDILSSIAEAFGRKNRLGKTEAEIATLPEVRREKIIRVRRQIDHGKYDLDERIDAVLEDILSDINP